MRAISAHLSSTRTGLLALSAALCLAAASISLAAARPEADASPSGVSELTHVPGQVIEAERQETSEDAEPSSDAP